MDNRKVFVIHGRDDSARRAMFAFLRSIELQPLEWTQLVGLTGKASPYVGEVLDKGFEVARAAVSLMTPDDVARLRTPLHRPNEPRHETELTGQPRQNVLLETGMAARTLCRTDDHSRVRKPPTDERHSGKACYTIRQFNRYATGPSTTTTDGRL